MPRSRRRAPRNQPRPKRLSYYLKMTLERIARPWKLKTFGQITVLSHGSSLELDGDTGFTLGELLVTLLQPNGINSDVG